MMSDITELNEQQLIDYERQFFDVLKCDQVKGAVRYATANIKAAIAAKWFAEPVDVDALDVAARRALSIKVDQAYSEAVSIDPN